MKFYDKYRNPFKIMPELEGYPEFQQDHYLTMEEAEGFLPVFDEMVRYSIYMYHPDSPLVKEKDMSFARSKALSEVDMDQDNADIIKMCKNPIVYHMMGRLLRIFNNHILTEYLSLRELFYNVCQTISEPNAGETGDERTARAAEVKLKSAEKASILREKLTELELTLFKGDEKAASTTLAESKVKKTASEKYSRSARNAFS